jgi:hypothetical protein
VVRTSLDDGDLFAEVSDILGTFRAQRVAVPRESPLTSPALKPQSPRGAEAVAPLLLEEEPAAAPPAEAEETPAERSVAYSALLDRLAGAEAPGTPDTEGAAGGPVSPLRRWSEKLSDSIRRAGDELLDKLERL